MLTLPRNFINDSLDDCLSHLLWAKKLPLVMNTDDTIAGYQERQEILLAGHPGDANRIGAMRVMEHETGQLWREAMPVHVDLTTYLGSRPPYRRDRAEKFLAL